MVAISVGALIISYLINFNGVRAEEEVVEAPLEPIALQVHGPSEAMSLDLLKPVNSSVMKKEVAGCLHRAPATFRPIAPNKLKNVSWSDSGIISFEEEDERSVDEVTVFRNCYDAVVAVKVGEKKQYFVAENDVFTEVDKETYDAEVAKVERKFTVDLTESEPSTCLVKEEASSYGVDWFSMFPVACYYVDKVTDKGKPIWAANGCQERFGGVTVVREGNEALVGLLVVDGEDVKAKHYRALDGEYAEVTNKEMHQYYDALKERQEATKAKVEAEEGVEKEELPIQEEEQHEEERQEEQTEQQEQPEQTEQQTEEQAA